MALDYTPEQWLWRLTRTHDNELPTLKALNAYYEGSQPLSYMHPRLIELMSDRLRQVVINWPRLVADSLEERLDVEGFRLPDTDEADEELWRVWQANDLDEGSQMGHVDALVMRRAFVTVGTNEDDSDTPLVTVESPLQMFAEFDPRTRRVVAAVKRWAEELGDFEGYRRDAAQLADHATLYLPNATHWYERKGAAGWVEIDRDDHGLGRPPVEPLVNRSRLMAPLGVSELTDVIPISDAACKIATDMMVSAEFHAMPRRYGLGFDEADFTDENGNAIDTWQVLAGRMWTTDKSPKDDGVAVGQFPEADLRNFHETLNQLARITGSLAALPAQYLGFTTDTPASADAIRSNETRLIKRAERKQRGFGGTWERSAQLVRRFQTGEWDPAYKQLETLWRDAATPTIAQKADAVQKLVAQNILPVEAAWEDLGYPSGRRKRLKALRDEEMQDPIVRGLLADVQAETVDQVAPPAVPDAAVGQ